MTVHHKQTHRPLTNKFSWQQPGVGGLPLLLVQDTREPAGSGNYPANRRLGQVLREQQSDQQEEL
jgi:hypothetical protein